MINSLPRQHSHTKKKRKKYRSPDTKVWTINLDPVTYSVLAERAWSPYPVASKFRITDLRECDVIHIDRNLVILSTTGYAQFYISFSHILGPNR